MIRVAVAVLALAAGPGAAAEVAPAASTAGAAATQAPVRVERRLLVKERHWFLSGGPAYLARGDYYASPAVAVSASFYPRERNGLELRLLGFWSRLGASAREVRDATGLVPDSHRPRTLLTAGWRRSLGYGKVLPVPSASVVHFDLQGVAAAGFLFTDRAVTPALAAGPGLLARLGRRAVAQVDVAVTLSFEPREHATISPGLLASLTVGGWL